MFVLLGLFSELHFLTIIFVFLQRLSASYYKVQSPLSFCHLPIRVKTEKSPGQAALESPFGFQVVVSGWLAGWRLRGHAKEWIAYGEEGGRSASQRKRKKERIRGREGGRANLHTLGAVKMSVEIE